MLSTSNQAAFRSVLGRLDRTSTPPPWVADGEVYGVERDGEFTPIGFAPHRPSDPKLIAAYRNAIPALVRVVDAVESIMTRAATDSEFAWCSAVDDTIADFDTSGANDRSRRKDLAFLHTVTTQPPWEPGHLATGMGWVGGPDAPSVSPRDTADAELIAAARVAVPRFLAFLIAVEAIVTSSRAAEISTDRARYVMAEITAFDSEEPGFIIPAGPPSAPDTPQPAGPHAPP